MSKIYTSLHIEGQLIYNNNPQEGYVLTTDSFGLVSWTSSTSVLPTASNTDFGYMKLGQSLNINTSGVTEIATASSDRLGGVRVGSGLTVSNTGLLSLSGGVSGNYLPLTGGTMSGDIHMNGAKIIGTDSNNYIQLASGYQYFYYEYDLRKSSIINNSGVELKGGFSDNSLYGDLVLNDTNSIFRYTKNGDSTSFTLSDDYSSGGGTASAYFEDSINNVGIVYIDDYSSNFVDNSLVTKKYVDSSYSVGLGLTSSNKVFRVATASSEGIGGIIVGSGLTVSNTGVLSVSGGGGTTYAAGVGLTLSGNTFSMISTNTKRIYVSVNGSDSNTGLIEGSPFMNLKTARDFASSGDMIIVLPGTFTFDNRDSNGNYWNSILDDLNLWKNGVNYYFSPGCKIIFYNQSVTGGQMDLLRPRGIVNETCNVYGYLEFEAYSFGPDTSNGHTYFFYGTTVDAVDVGYTCFLQVKSLYSECMEMLYISRGTTISGTAKVTIEADSAIKNFVTGQGGSYTCLRINGKVGGLLEFHSNIRYMSSNFGSTCQFKGDLSSTLIYIRGEVIICTDLVVFQVLPQPATDATFISDKGVINLDFKKIYFKGPASNTGSVIDTHNSFPVSVELLINLKGDCIEYEATGNAKTLFNVYNYAGSTAKKVINYVGNIYTITASGETTQSLYSQGRRIVYSMGPNTFVNIKGDINYNGTLVTLREAFKTGDGGTINYSGNIRGNFGCPITKCNTGVINISNSTIISEIDSNVSSILGNGFCYINSNGGLTGNFATGKVIINNSYIKLNNSAGYIGNGGYLNSIITNSIIINSATSGSGIINQVPYYSDTATVYSPSDSTPNGKLQMVNSSILVGTSSNSFYYIDTTVITSNSTTNASWTVSTGLKGSLDLLSDLSNL